jgi:hypothetical protein
MPGLRLTFPQARRLLGVDAEICAMLLKSLVEDEFRSAARMDGSGG